MSSEVCATMAVGLTAADMHKSIRFYRDQLGFELKECWPDEKQPMWCSLSLDGQSVMFGKAGPPEEVEKHCAGNPAAAKFWSEHARRFPTSPHGVGVTVYLAVEDIDAYHKTITQKGIKPNLPPTTQFYGLRDSVVTDPDGYTLVFFTPVKLSSCQSCGMPLKEAKAGQMYCQYCTDEHGQLRPYEQVYEGTVSGFFMAMQKMPRKDAEKAAGEHLKKMPAWAGRK